VRRIVFTQELAPSVRGEALKTVEKKRQDFGSTEGCAQKDSVEQLQREGLKTVAHSNKNEQQHTYHRKEAGTRPRTTIAHPHRSTRPQ